MSMQLGPLTPERRRELTRTALVEAAAQVFARRGFHAASLDEVAEAAGFTRGAIYSNFKSKEDLLLAVVEWYTRAQLDAFSSVLDRAEGGPEERAAAAAELWSSLVDRDRTLLLLSLELRLYALRNPDLARRLAVMQRAHSEQIANLIESQARAHGWQLPHAAADLAEIAWAAGDGLVQLAAIDEERKDHYDRIARLLFEILGQAAVEPDEPTQDTT